MLSYAKHEPGGMQKKEAASECASEIDSRVARWYTHLSVSLGIQYKIKGGVKEDAPVMLYGKGKVVRSFFSPLDITGADARN